MKQIICAVHDRQLSAYMRPFTAQSAGQAIRSFRDEVNRPDSELNRHPEDYELHQLGHFDEHTGQITQCDGATGPVQMVIATNLIERK